jgi:hypothetical protein
MLTIAQKIKRHMARHRTTDSRRITVQERMRTHDVKLTPEVSPKNPGMFPNSTAETGALEHFITAKLAGMSAQERDAATKRIRDALEEFGSEDTVHESETMVEGGPAGSKSTIGRMQEANDRLWKGTNDAAAAEISRPGTPASINLANQKFWAGQPGPATLGGRWGAGGK